MSEIFGIVVLALTVLIIGVNVLTTFSSRFRRWLYSKD